MLTSNQMSILMAASEADSIAYQLSQYVSIPLRVYSPFDRHAMVTDWLAVADKLKIEGNRDRFALCKFALYRPELAGGARYLVLLESDFAPSSLVEARAFLLEEPDILSTT